MREAPRPTGRTSTRLFMGDPQGVGTFVSVDGPNKNKKPFRMRDWRGRRTLEVAQDCEA